MKTYLVNYADLAYYRSQKINTYTGLNVGKLSDAFEYSISDIDDDFKRKNAHILSQQRGAGYWLWKPYFILKSLNNVNEGDVIFYSDAGAEFIDDVSPLVDICVRETKGVVCFAIDPHKTGNPDVGQIKRDALIITECDSSEYTSTNARLASFIVLQKNDLTMKFVSEWLSFCEDERALTDIPNQLGENHQGFIVHRHDQAIFSVLSKKYGFDAYLDPSQWGIPFRGLIKGNYPQLIQHTRNRG